MTRARVTDSPGKYAMSGDSTALSWASSLRHGDAPWKASLAGESEGVVAGLGVMLIVTGAFLRGWSRSLGR